MKSQLRFVAVLLIPASAWLIAQDTRATLLGKVVDSTAAAIPGAKVVATNIETGVKSASQVNESGLFEIAYLLPGSYSVTVEAHGFKTFVRQGLELRISDRVNIEISLELGDVSESIQVTSATPLLETATGSTGTVVDHRSILDLPTSGGNPLTLAQLSAAVTNFAIVNHPYELTSAWVASRISVSGTRSQNTEFTVDGVPAMENDSAVYSPPANMVQEVKVETNSFNAASGHSVGGYVNTITRSGTNELHGRLYEFYTGDRLKGLDFFERQHLYDPSSGPPTEAKANSIKGHEVNNRFGLSFGGPMVLPRLYNGRNKTFWMYGYEGFRHPSIDANSGYFSTVPTAAERKGDLSQLLGYGSIYQVYNPYSTTPAANGRYTRTPFPGNLIPSSLVDATALNLLNYYPLPNTGGTQGVNNYFNSVRAYSGYDTHSARIDQNSSDRERFFVRLNTSAYNGANYGAFDNVATTSFNQYATNGAALSNVYIFSPTFLVNVRYGFMRYAPSTTSGSAGINLTPLGFSPTVSKQIDPQALSLLDITFDSFAAIGSATPTREAIGNHFVGVDFSNERGRHSLHFGGEFRVFQDDMYNFGHTTPKISFDGTYTRGPFDNSASAPLGQGLASFLMGIPSSGSAAVSASYAFTSRYYGLFFQDDWRISNRLTLNLGLRYEYENAPSERYNRTVEGFDATTRNPIAATAIANYALHPISQLPASQFTVNGGLTFAGVNGQPSALWRSDPNNFAPRFGLAYQLNSKTVVRGGYGIYYMPKGVDRFGTAADRTTVNQTGFSQTTSIVASTDNGQHYIDSLSNPFPTGIQPPVGASAGLATSLGQSISFFNPQQINPLVQRWDFSVQRELPGRILAEVMYIGTSGSGLSTTRQIDATPAQYLSTSSFRDSAAINAMSQQVSNPFYPQLPGTSLSSSTVAVAQLLRPYPQFTGITYNDPIGSSIYHGLAIQTERRFSSGVTVRGAYTFSKFLNTTDYLNATDARPSKVVSDQDVPNRLSISGIFDIPIGKGRKLPLHGVWGALAGGWQVQAIYAAQSGSPLGFGDALFLGDIHNITLPNDQKRVSEWFNINAGFDRNSADQRSYDIRVMSQRFPSVLGQGINNWNTSGMKYFQITEGAKLQFRIEMMNAGNHSQFTAPNTTPTSAAFGQITGVQSVARQIFFASTLAF